MVPFVVRVRGKKVPCWISLNKKIKGKSGSDNRQRWFISGRFGYVLASSCRITELAWLEQAKHICVVVIFLFGLCAKQVPVFVLRGKWKARNICSIYFEVYDMFLTSMVAV